ncbi:ATP-binding protein, partial [Actinoplanes sp. NPDC048791]|uniref:ATP-binding protein n=1 Tax=Actinoplanes sp. NPDC048791 TaxID=3154623 RepID=UPI0034050917
ELDDRQRPVDGHVLALVLGVAQLVLGDVGGVLDHLELIENATMFAPPQTQVLLRAQHVAAGVAVEVEDRGLGIQREDQDRLNRLLVNPEDINLDELLRDGRIGLFVVSMIARQHGVTVQLQGNIYGGTQAVIILPQQLLGSAQDDRGPVVAQPALTQNTMELVQRVPGPSQIAAPPPTWPAFTGAPDTPAPALVSAVPAPAISAPPISAPQQQAPPQQAPVQAATPQQATPQAAPPQQAPLQQAPPNPAPVAAGALRRTGAEVAEGRPTVTPPPLPRRHSQTHLAPQLQFGPPPAPEDDGAEHDPGLMASFMQGVSRSDAGPHSPAEPAPSDQH